MFIDDVCEINDPNCHESEKPKPKEKEKPKETKPTATKQKDNIIFERRVTRSMSKSGMLLYSIIYFKIIVRSFS